MIHRAWLLARADAIVDDALPAPTNQWVLICEVEDDEDGFLFAELFGWDPADKPGRRELVEMIEGYAGHQVTLSLREVGYIVDPNVTVVDDHF